MALTSLTSLNELYLIYMSSWRQSPLPSQSAVDQCTVPLSNQEMLWIVCVSQCQQFPYLHGQTSNKNATSDISRHRRHWKEPFLLLWVIVLFSYEDLGVRAVELTESLEFFLFVFWEQCVFAISCRALGIKLKLELSVPVHHNKKRLNINIGQNKIGHSHIL